MTTKEECLEFIDKEIKYMEYQIASIRKTANKGDWSKENKVAQLVDVIRGSVQTIGYWERKYIE